MLEEGKMYPNGKLIWAKLEVPRSGVEREDQGRASEQADWIGLDWIGLEWSE